MEVAKRGAQVAIRRAKSILRELGGGTREDEEDDLKLHPDAEEPLTLHDFDDDDDDDALRTLLSAGGGG